MKATKARKKVLVNDDDVSFESPKLSTEERAQAGEALRKYREIYEANRTPEAKLRTDLRQLRILMEEYIKSDKFDDKLGFGYFLKEYIERLHKKNNEFADEINVSPSEISQFINKRREPGSRFFVLLEIHSNKIFPALMWYKIFSKEKAMELFDYALKGDVEKQVKKRISLSF